MSDEVLRGQLADFLDWKSAHVGFDDVVKGIPPETRGAVPAGFAHSAWQLVEHLRIAQHDILDFCRNRDYKPMAWPDDYWPPHAAPKDAAAWNDSLEAYRNDRRSLQQLASDPRIDLFATIPHGSGQTYLRELLLVVDHAAYHLAQIVDVRRALGIWEG